ncbi:MAG: hypothetical protein ABI595_16245 [Actinomycetota bacterium]
MLTGFCPFTVIATDEGKVFQDVFLDDEGNVVKIHIYSPGLRSTFEANGKSVTLQNSGPVFLTIDENGVFTAEQRGESISFDQGLITGDPYILHVSGRITTHAVFNEETGYVDFIDSTRSGSLRMFAPCSRRETRRGSAVPGSTATGRARWTS